MTEPTIPGEFSDVNEAVGAEWEAETTPHERVRAVIAHTYTAVSADTVAEAARTSPKTARKHLDALADGGFVTTEPGEHGGTRYRRSAESLVVEQAAGILDRVSVDELADRIAEMRETIAEFRREYGVDSPAELAVAEANRTLSDTPSTGNEVDAGTVREWRTTRRNLAFATAALSIANAERFVDGGDGPLDGSVPAG